MDGEDSTAGGGGTPRKALWRSASWSVRSRPDPNPNPTPSGRPKPGRPSLPPLQPLSISRRAAVNAWPNPGSDDGGPHLHPPSTPSSSSSSSFADDGECSRIADHVYLGSDAVARDRPALRRHGITHVLNCVGSKCPNYFSNDSIAYKTLWLHDSPAEDITSILYDAFDFLEDVRSASGGRALVHCLRGASRSAAVVIAYLMWRDSLPFDAALKRVRSARAVTDPNLGFASQLLNCQRRLLGPPPSPRAGAVYRMAPHSPYDPLHLVPKAVEGAAALDSRGAFIVHVSSAIFVWVGRRCEPAMADAAASSARQIVRYERAQGPIIPIAEGSETLEFWAAVDEKSHLGVGPGDRRVELYDLDYEIFRRALKGGVLPSLPMPGSGSETRLPARENGWTRVREKFQRGGVRELLSVARQEEQFRSPGSSSTPSSSSDTASTFSPLSNSSSDWPNSSPSSFVSSSSPNRVGGLPPPPLRKGKEKAEPSLSKADSFRSIAERRGGNAPSLVLLPVDSDAKGQLSPTDIVRDWCLSPPFVSEVEEDRATAMDVDQVNDDDQEEESVSEDDQNDHNQLTHPILFRWPSMDRVEVIQREALNSGSVFLLLAPDSGLGPRKRKVNTLFVWLGKQSGATEEDFGQFDLDRIRDEFFVGMELPVNIPVQIIREDEEPQQFLNLLFSFHKPEI